mgnify:CR=1 FL=1
MAQTITDFQSFLEDAKQAVSELSEFSREEERLRQALKISGGNKGKAAKLLGIDRSTLWRRMKKYEI